MGQCLSIANQALQAVLTAEPDPLQEGIEQNQQQQTSSLSPIYASLPPDVEKHTVRNVYDGDTLTLTDERRVRLLGIDTPELKEHQPFAEEAKAYTKSKCYNGREIWISFERNMPRQDHYGRLLAFVWVQNDNSGSGSGGYLNVNEGIVAAGLASAYIPNQQSKLHNWDKLVQLQSRARSQKLGMWSTGGGGAHHDDNTTVYTTANGSAFHKKDCEHLANIKHLTAMKQSEAMEKGLHACRTCLAG